MEARDPEVLTAKEIAELLGVVKTTIIRRANKEDWPFIPGNGRGGKIKKYLFHALPEEIKLLYNKRVATTMPEVISPLSTPAPTAVSPVETDHLISGETSLVPGTSARPHPPSVPGAPSLKIVCPGLAEWQNEIALARFDLVTDFVKAKTEAKKSRNNGGKLKVKIAIGDFVGAYNTGITYPNTFEILGKVTAKTIEKWGRLLRNSKYDFTALAPQYGRHRKGVRIVTADEMQEMLNFALHPNRHRISSVIRFTKKVMAQDGLVSASSEATLRRALIDWKNKNLDRWTFLREGKKMLTDKILPYAERDTDYLEVGDILVADGHTLNFQVINPFTGKPCRATLLMFFDWASRYPAGWYIMATENVMCIHAALRRAILSLGKIPNWVVLDNGKAFRAKFFTGTHSFEDAGMQGMYARLGIRTHFAAPYNARAKVIERFFGTFNEMERLLPSYVGASIPDQPAYMQRNEKLHRKLHDPHVPSIWQADAAIKAWIDGEYATRPHRGIRGECPSELWKEGKGPGIDEEGLRYLMMTHEIKTIHRNGITLFGVNYYDEALYGYRKKVLIRYDILNMDQIYVYSEDGSKFFCEAKPVRGVKALAKMTGCPIDMMILKENLKQQKRLKRKTESEARALATEIAPWNFPEAEVEEVHLPLSPAQIEEINEQVAKTEVIHLDEKEDEKIITWEGEFYEYCLERQMGGEVLPEEDIVRMETFKVTKQYHMLKPGYADLERRAAEAQKQPRDK